MPRILWLVFERMPHPDAVSFPAAEDDAQFVVELLSRPHAVRRRIAEQFRNYLKEQEKLTPWERNRVPCRRASGLFQLVPWRLAKWLSRALSADDAVAARTAARIVRWLHRSAAEAAVDPFVEAPKGRNSPAQGNALGE